MTRIIKIKNCQIVADTYCGQEIQPGQYYQLQESEFITWASNQKVQNHLSADPVKIIVNNGDDDLNYDLGKQHLEGSSPKDEYGRPYAKNVSTIPQYHYTPRSLDFYTAKHKSLYNKSHYGDGTIDGALDLEDAWVKYFDADNVEIVQEENESDEDYQIRITANCTKTILYFEPEFDYDVFGAKLQFRNIPQDRAYFWFVAAPDIPAEYGGNVVFMGGGMNISFFNEKETFECDGKTCSKITYDSTYHIGMVALIVKHNVGVQIGIQLIYQFYS